VADANSLPGLHNKPTMVYRMCMMKQTKEGHSDAGFRKSLVWTKKINALTDK